MKNKIYCIGLLTMLYLHPFAQGFDKTFAIDSAEQIDASVGLGYTPEKYYFFGLGKTHRGSIGSFGAELFVTDTNGNLIYTAQNKSNTQSFWDGYNHCFLVNHPNELLFATGYQDLSTLPTETNVGVITAYDSLLNIRWQKTFFNSIGHNTFFKTILKTPEGQFLVLGHTDKIGAGNRDILLLKLDSLGNTLWQKTYGSTKQDWACSLRILSDGNYLIGGNTVTTFFPNTDGWIIKTDTAGNILWDKKVGGIGADWGCYFFSDNLFYQVSDTGMQNVGEIIGERIVRLHQIDPNGNIIWEEKLETNEDIIIRNALTLQDGGFVVVADYLDTKQYMGAVAWIVRYDANKNKLWERFYFRDNAKANGLLEIVEDSMGNLIFAGTILTTDSIYNADIWALKLNANGCLHSEYCGVSVGVLDATPPKNHFEITVNPNPATDKINILVKNSSQHIGKFLDLFIFNQQGQKIYTSQTQLVGQMPLFSIHCSTWSKGTYFIQAHIETKQYATQKFILK